MLAEIVSGRIVGAEATVMSHDGWAVCSADNELLPVDGVVGQLRRAKDEAEIVYRLRSRDWLLERIAFHWASTHTRCLRA